MRERVVLKIIDEGFTDGEIELKERSYRCSQSIEPYEVRSGATNFPWLMNESFSHIV